MELVPFKAMLSERFGPPAESQLIDYQVPKGKQKIYLHA